MRGGDMAFEWFERDDYPAILELMEDVHRLPPTYAEWEKNADAGVRALEAAGHVVVPTLIEPKAFAAWCEANDTKPDARARLKFCNTMLRRPEPRETPAPHTSEQTIVAPDVGHDGAEGKDGSQTSPPPADRMAADNLSKDGGVGSARSTPSKGLLRHLWNRLFLDRHN